MKRRVLSLLLGTAMVSGMLVGCGGSGDATATDSAATEESTDTAEAGGAGGTIGLAMPTQSSERWINDAANMQKQLEAKGYKVEVQFAEDDVQQQVSQIEYLIA